MYRMKLVRDKIDLNFISFYGHTAPHKNKSNSFVSDESYTLFYDKQSKGIFKGTPKDMSTSKFMLIFLIVYPTMNYFPNDVIPYDNPLALYILGLIAIVFSLAFGLHLSLTSYKEVRTISLSEEEWQSYLEKGNKFYIRQLVVIIILLLCAISCIVCLAIFQSKWWLFGSIGISIFLGTMSTICTKTRYLLYRNQLDVVLDLHEGQMHKR